MATKPILFSTPMVQALLDGRKTMTRRMKGAKIVNSDIDNYTYIHQTWDVYGSIIFRFDHATSGFTFVRPQFNVNDILWVREKFEIETDGTVKFYAANVEVEHNTAYRQLTKWKPSIHMPKEAARIFLKVTDIKIQRLQDISEEDAIREGVMSDMRLPFNKYLNYDKSIYQLPTAKDSFQTLWISINGKDSWDANPWVIAYTFERVEKPEGF